MPAIPVKSLKTNPGLIQNPATLSMKHYEKLSRNESWQLANQLCFPTHCCNFYKNDKVNSVM